MKIILINTSSNIIKSLSRPRRLVSYEFPSIGLAYVAAILEKNGIKVYIIDQFIQNIDTSKILEIIKEESTDIVGLSCLTHNMGTAKEIAREIKKFNPRTKIVLGNTHASFFADDLLKQKIADIIVRGEGEYSMLEIAKAIERGSNLHGVKGISFIEEGNIYHNSDREPIVNLDELPYPAWHLFKLSLHPPLFLNGSVLPIRTSRGCNYNCYFCVQDKIFKNPRMRAIKNVIDEIEYMIDKFKVYNFAILDSYFPFTIEYGFKFSDEIIRRNLHSKIKWAIEARVDKVSPELLRKMKEAGLQFIMYGFETGNQRILDNLLKGTTLEQAKKIMRNTKEARIFSEGLFILGMPGETKETCEETIKFAKELDCDLVKFNLAMPFPGSKFYEHYKDKIVDINQHPEKFDSWYSWSSYAGNPVYVPEGLTGRELISLQRKAMLQFYIRPRWIARQMVKGRISSEYMFCGAYVLLSDLLKNLINEFKRFFN